MEGVRHVMSVQARDDEIRKKMKFSVPSNESA